MSERSTSLPPELTFSAEASPARTSATPDSAPESTASARDSGESSLVPFASFDPGSSSLRTSQPSLFEESTESSVTFPRSGTMRSGRLYERPTWVRLIAESGSSLWPTARARDDHGPGFGDDLPSSAEAWPTPRARDSRGPTTAAGAEGGPTLGEAVRLWPTPMAGPTSEASHRQLSGDFRRRMTEALSWPTPTRADGSSGSDTYPRGNLTLRGATDRWPTPNTADASRGTGAYPPGETKTQTHLGDAISHWPTPQARDEKGPTGATNRLENGGRRSSLSDSAMPGATAGRLNPRWSASSWAFPRTGSMACGSRRRPRALGAAPRRTLRARTTRHAPSSR